MRLNRTSVWKVMSIWISQELPLFNFKLLDILCTWIGLPCDKLWPFEFLESFRCLISSFRIYYAPESDFRVTSYDHFNFSRASVVQYRESRNMMRLNRICEGKVMTIWISRELLLFNFERLYMWCKSDLQVKSYDHLNCSIASIVQFRASRYILRLSRTSEWKVTTIWMAQELLLFNFELLDILCAWIGPAC